MIKIKTTARRLPIAIFAVHLIFYISFSLFDLLDSLEFFNLLLLGGNLVTAILLYTGRIKDIATGAASMFLIGSHAFIGQFLAPDSLTSGAILIVNIFVVYTGIRIHRHMRSSYWYAFVISYLSLFWLFIIKQENAEALFLASSMALCGVSRNYKLFAHFWGIVLAFTLFQPYSWETALISIIVVQIIFSVKGFSDSITIRVFLLTGLILLFLVLMPVIAVILAEDPRNIINVLKDSRVISALKTTLLSATISTLILIVFFTPFAYAVSRLRFRGKILLLSFIDVPIIIPQSVAGIALLKIFGSQQVLGEALNSLFGLKLDNSLYGICLAQIFVAMPFFVKTAITSFDNVPEELEMSARSLGSTQFGSMMRIAIPLSLKGLFLGVVLAWARAAGEFGAVYFIAEHPETIPRLAYNYFEKYGMVETTPVIAAFLLFSLVMFFMLQFVSRLLPGMRSIRRNYE